MKLHQAIEAMQHGRKVMNGCGWTYWLERNAKGRMVLIGLPRGLAHPVRNLVIASEHFADDGWEIVECEVQH